MRLFRILWRILAPFRREFFIYLGIILVYESLQIVDSYVLGVVVDLIGKGVGPRILLALLLGITVFDEIFMRLDQRLDWQIIAKIYNPIYRFLKKNALRRFMAMEVGWHRKQRSGALIGKVQDGVDRVSDLISGISWEFAPTMLQVVLSLIPLLFTSWQIALVIAVSLTIFLVISLRLYKAQAPIRKRRHDAYEDEWAMSQEAVENIETVVLHNQQGRILANHDAVLETIQTCSIEDARLGIFKFGSWRNHTINIARRVVLALLMWQVLGGAITIGTLVFIWTLSEKIFHSFWRFTRFFDRAAQSSESANRLQMVLGLVPSITDPEEPAAVPEGSVALTFDNVWFSYDGNGDSIVDLNLTICAGETVAVVGPSGAGKTTLRRVLTRAWDIAAGRVLVNGVDIRDLKLGDLRQLFAYVPQGDETTIFNESFAYNVAFGRPDASMAKVIEAAKIAGIHDFVSKCEDGYDTLLGERGLRLSGGQKQRVALARAILADRPVLILDEATSSVDSITEGEIQEKLMPILRDGKRTVIIIAHRLSTVLGVADRILVFDHGRLVEEGTHEELLARGGLYGQLYARQFA